MSCICSFVSVNSAGIYKSVRGLMCLHIAYTSACKVRTQAELVACFTLIVSFKPVCIHAFSCRMVGREIQLIKSIKLTCDIILLKNFKSHRSESVIEVIAHLSYRMKSSMTGNNTRSSIVKVRRYLTGFKFKLLIFFFYQL